MTTTSRSFKNRIILILSVILFSVSIGATAQTTTNVTIPAGSFIINMGVLPQTVANGLKPYGLVYELLANGCSVDWVINGSKVKDGADFSYNNVDYKGGPFVIHAEYRTTAINAIIAKWQALGVQGITTTSPVTVPVYLTFQQIPRWTMDLKNGGIATVFFTNAGIPASAYGGASTYWKTPAMLNCCDDVFVMPHADPVWLTHSRLYSWVTGSEGGCKGGVWLGCHAGSALENMFDNITTDGDPIDANQQTNFLSEKSGPAVGAGPWSTPGNSLILWGSHADGTLPYTFNNVYAGDPVAQYMGSTDAAQQNGSEQIYIPAHASAGWRPTTKVLVYDTDHPNAKGYPSTPMTHKASVMVYGPAFGVTGNGKIFLEAGHSIAGTAPANIAAQRAFLNYSFLVAWEKAVLPVLKDIPPVIYTDENTPLTFEFIFNTPPPREVGAVIIKWTASVPGTFTPNDYSKDVFFKPAAGYSNQICNISVTIEDECHRKTFDTHSAMVTCRMTATPQITNPCNGQETGGAINFTVDFGTAPYTWSYIKNGIGTPVTGTGTSITGLSAGDYVVTVKDQNGTGCSTIFNATLSMSPALNVTPTLLQPTCFGATNGAINITVSGGTPPYTYLWSDGGITTPNRSALAAESYTLTVTDAKNCATVTAINLTQPAALTATPTVLPVTCFNAANGSITLAVSGGTAPYQYLWNDGSALKDRTGLAPGTYSVTVTDKNGCTITKNNLEITQPTAALATIETHVDATCYGSSTGSIDLSVTGGTTDYTYAWTGPGTFTAATQDLSNLAAGTYNVIVTDARGCTTNRQVVITQPAAMSLTTTVTQPTCPPTAQLKNSDGAINLTVSGGTPGYTYSWIGPNSYSATTRDISGLIAGTYTVEVTDANGCKKTTSVTLNYLNPNPVKPGTINH